LSSSRLTCRPVFLSPFFCFTAAATLSLSTLSLHDALPIFIQELRRHQVATGRGRLHLQTIVGRLLAVLDIQAAQPLVARAQHDRSEEHTSELQSRENLVCRLLLEKKKIHHRR